MGGDPARTEAEALRYRLQVRLAAVVRTAKAEGRSDLAVTAQELRTQVGALSLAENPVTGSQQLQSLEPGIAALERALGLEAHGVPTWPKWVRYLLYTGPVLSLLLLGLLLLERRRRKKRITDSALAALDRAGDSS